MIDTLPTVAVSFVLSRKPTGNAWIASGWEWRALGGLPDHRYGAHHTSNVTATQEQKT